MGDPVVDGFCDGRDHVLDFAFDRELRAGGQIDDVGLAANHDVFEDDGAHQPFRVGLFRGDRLEQCSSHWGLSFF